MALAAVILCATPRSGSTLLCDLLTESGVAGRPASFYRQQSIAYYAEQFGVPPGEGSAFDRDYLAAVRQHGTDDTGTFSLRIMWSSVADLMARLAPLFPDWATDAARFERAFGAPLYVHLSRRNKVAQAVSRLKAEQTGLWHRAADGSERERTAPAQPAVYDGARLAAFVAEAVAATREREVAFPDGRERPTQG